MVKKWLSHRQQEIVDTLKKYNEMSVEELAACFSVTSATIRRELTYLEENMFIIRSHGHARIAGDSVSAFDIRAQTFHEEKMLIAQKALEYIKPSDNIIIDSGTTTYALASAIANSGIEKLAIVTNSLPIANVLAGKCMVLVTGGMLDEATLSLLGPAADSCIESVVATKLFIGATGISIPLGLTTKSPLQMSIKSKMIRSAEEIFVLVDPSKFNAGGFSVFCRPEQIGTIITIRTHENAEKIEEIRALGVCVDYIDMYN